MRIFDLDEIEIVNNRPIRPLEKRVSGTFRRAAAATPSSGDARLNRGSLLEVARILS